MRRNPAGNDIPLRQKHPAGIRGPGILAMLDQLRTELADLAYALDTGGRHDAADLAASILARLTEICADHAARAAPRSAVGVRIAAARSLSH